MIRVQDQVYEIVEENKNGFNQEVFKERYSDILSKFDYIVGDWGYGQLRLKGLFEDTNRKAPFDARISFLDEYLMEYCNFGCAYFLLKKVRQASRITEAEEIESLDEEGTLEYTDEKTAKPKEKRRDRDAKRRPRPRRKPKDTKDMKEKNMSHT